MSQKLAPPAQTFSKSCLEYGIQQVPLSIEHGSSTYCLTFKVEGFGPGQ